MDGATVADKGPSNGVQTYLQVLGLAQPEARIARKAALDRAHEVRQFEIDLYWKRANFFWLLQAAVFAAVGLTWKSDATALPTIMPMALAALGCVTAWAGCLANQGSKFWQRNWEHHIDMLESEFEGDLYKTVYISRSGIKWSLTGVSESLSLCLTIFWLLILGAVSISSNPNWTYQWRDLTYPHTASELEALLCWAGAFAGMFLLWKQVTGISGNKIELPEEMHRYGAHVGHPSLFHAGSAAFLLRREPLIIGLAPKTAKSGAVIGSEGSEEQAL